jgi:hypothetical protein
VRTARAGPTGIFSGGGYSANHLDITPTVAGRPHPGHEEGQRPASSSWAAPLAIGALTSARVTSSGSEARTSVAELVAEWWTLFALTVRPCWVPLRCCASPHESCAHTASLASWL